MCDRPFSPYSAPLMAAASWRVQSSILCTLHSLSSVGSLLVKGSLSRMMTVIMWTTTMRLVVFVLETSTVSTRTGSHREMPLLVDILGRDQQQRHSDSLGGFELEAEIEKTGRSFFYWSITTVSQAKGERGHLSKCISLLLLHFMPDPIESVAVITCPAR